jgi:hypothetical protein
MDKRGQSLLFVVFSFIASILILISATTIAKRIATGEDIQQSYLAKDSALMIDAFHAVPGDVTFNYMSYNFSENMKMSLFLDNSVQVVPEIGAFAAYSFRLGVPRVTIDEIQIEAGKRNILDFSKNDSRIEVKKKVQQ